MRPLLLAGRLTTSCKPCSCAPKVPTATTPLRLQCDHFLQAGRPTKCMLLLLLLLLAYRHRSVLPLFLALNAGFRSSDLAPIVFLSRSASKRRRAIAVTPTRAPIHALQRSSRAPKAARSRRAAPAPLAHSDNHDCPQPLFRTAARMRPLLLAGPSHHTRTVLLRTRPAHSDFSFCASASHFVCCGLHAIMHKHHTARYLLTTCYGWLTHRSLA